MPTLFYNEELDAIIFRYQRAGELRERISYINNAGRPDDFRNASPYPPGTPIDHVYYADASLDIPPVDLIGIIPHGDGNKVFMKQFGSKAWFADDGIQTLGVGTTYNAIAFAENLLTGHIFKEQMPVIGLSKVDDEFIRFKYQQQVRMQSSMADVLRALKNNSASKRTAKRKRERFTALLDERTPEITHNRQLRPRVIVDLSLFRSSKHDCILSRANAHRHRPYHNHYFTRTMTCAVREQPLLQTPNNAGRWVRDYSTWLKHWWVIGGKRKANDLIRALEYAEQQFKHFQDDADPALLYAFMHCSKDGSGEDSLAAIIARPRYGKSDKPASGIRVFSSLFTTYDGIEPIHPFQIHAPVMPNEQHFARLRSV